jgi:hypothetical protein
MSNYEMGRNKTRKRTKKKKIRKEKGGITWQ